MASWGYHDVSAWLEMILDKVSLVLMSFHAILIIVMLCKHVLALL